MATLETEKPEGLESFNLPPAAEPSSPLDNNNNNDPTTHSTWDPRLEFYAPNRQNQTQSQTQLHQPLIQPPNPYGHNADTASIAPSVATSQLPAYDATRTTDNARYGAHRSEEEYLAALRAWAAEKQYVQLDKKGGLPGFYGNEELEERANRMKAQRRAEKEIKLRRKMERRGTVAGVTGEGEAAAAAAADAGGRRRGGSVVQFFRRQSTAV